MSHLTFVYGRHERSLIKLAMNSADMVPSALRGQDRLQKDWMHGIGIGRLH